MAFQLGGLCHSNKRQGIGLRVSKTGAHRENACTLLSEEFDGDGNGSRDGWNRGSGLYTKNSGNRQRARVSKVVRL